jgi:hypothetical protein
MQQRLSAPMIVDVLRGERNGSIHRAPLPMSPTMRLYLPPAEDEASSSQRDRRASGRMRVEGVVCKLGPVLDLSAGGMRVLSTRRHRGAMTLRLQSWHEKLAVRGQVMWCIRAGFRRTIVGIKFLDVDAETARALTDLATSCGLRLAA